jgi:hypothetical protein
MRILFSFFILSILVACNNETNKRIAFDSKLSDSLLLQLNKAYQDSSDSQLLDFLNDWSHRYKGKSVSEIDIKDRGAYEIFQKFYSPFNINRIGGCEWNELNTGIKYLIIQDKLRINKKHKKDSVYFGRVIDNFRPKLNFGDSIKVLYLTAEYYSAINRFLRKEFYPLGTGDIMNPAFPRGSSYLRYKFLYKHLNIFSGHWGGYWQLQTPPSISFIEYGLFGFKATVYFRLIYEGGEAKFKKGLKGWRMIESKRTWIE